MRLIPGGGTRKQGNSGRVSVVLALSFVLCLVVPSVALAWTVEIDRSMQRVSFVRQSGDSTSSTFWVYEGRSVPTTAQYANGVYTLRPGETGYIVQTAPLNTQAIVPPANCWATNWPYPYLVTTKYLLVWETRSDNRWMFLVNPGYDHAAVGAPGDGAGWANRAAQVRGYTGYALEVRGSIGATFPVSVEGTPTVSLEPSSAIFTTPTVVPSLTVDAATVTVPASLTVGVDRIGDVGRAELTRGLTALFALLGVGSVGFWRWFRR